jgi:hypothetical protein
MPDLQDLLSKEKIFQLVPSPPQLLDQMRKAFSDLSIDVTDPSNVPPGGNPPFKRLGNKRLFYANEVYVSTVVHSVNVRYHTPA